VGQSRPRTEEGTRGKPRGKKIKVPTQWINEGGKSKRGGGIRVEKKEHRPYTADTLLKGKERSKIWVEAPREPEKEGDGVLPDQKIWEGVSGTQKIEKSAVTSSKGIAKYGVRNIDRKKP